jgi:hypothetical protein
MVSGGARVRAISIVKYQLCTHVNIEIRRSSLLRPNRRIRVFLLEVQ